ncbi:MAG TPA: hypothetical protein VND45_03230, partial [Thermoanaerobaculia bacterium]|nr:hypothetical protein [Thermoanaerobaculia bacterium]
MTTKRAAVATLFLSLFAGAAMAAPGGFTLTNARMVCTNTTPSLTFDWTPSSGATSYEVVRDSVFLANTNSTSFEDTNVVSGQTYTYAVFARDATPDRTRSANTVTMTAPYCTPPDSPTLTATLICQSGNAAVQLTWTAAARTDTYDVFRNGVVIRSNLPASTTSIVDTNVTVGTTYSYFVRPQNLSTSGPPSPPPPSTPRDSNTETLVVTNPCPPPPSPPTVTTSAFCGTAAGLPSPKVTVSWSAPAGATSYSLFRNDTFITTTTGTTYEDPNVSAGA